MSEVSPSSKPEATAKLAQRIYDLQNWTCAIDTGVGARGTGLLVGPDLVLTNFHVVERLLSSPRGIAASCGFDFREDPATEKINKGRQVYFAEDWCVERSPPSAADIKGLPTGFQRDEVDYAIIRLTERIGDQPPGLPGDRRAGAPRGWLPLSEGANPPKQDATVYVFHHSMQTPDMLTGEQNVIPLQYADGAVIEYLDGGQRMRHTVTTYKGASGAPVFDSKYQLVALHNSGDKMADMVGRGQWNQAIPIAGIVNHLRGRGHASLISEAPPRSPVRDDAAIKIDTAVQAQQGVEDAITHQLWAASILMDRDAVERRIIGVRKKAAPDRGMVHVLACRQVDRHQYFLKRQSVVTVDDSQDKQRRRLALLGSNSDQPTSPPAWRPARLEWLADVKETVALDNIKDSLQENVLKPGRSVVTATVDVGLVKIARERRMLEAVAAFCKGISDADNLQVFVVYHDPSDKFSERRRQLGSLWEDDEHPPGCGVCISLDDVGSGDLGDWCNDLQAAWTLPDGVMDRLVDAVFVNPAKMPILNVENSIAPDLRKLISKRI